MKIDIPDSEIQKGVCINCGKQIIKRNNHYIHANGFSHVCFFEDGRFYFAEPIEDLAEWILSHWDVKDIQKFAISFKAGKI